MRTAVGHSLGVKRVCVIADNKIAAPSARRGWSGLALVICICLPPPAPAEGNDLLYRTRRGDTLVGIGERLLRRPADWPTVQRLNHVADPYRMPSGKTLRIPLRLLRLEAAPASVATVTGEVRSNGRPLAPGSALPEGSQVTTGEDGYITIELADGSKLTLQPRSKLRLDSLRRYRNTAVYGMLMNLKEGRLETEAAKVAGAAARHELRHPGAVLSVRGTRYRAAVTGPRSGVVEVTQGAVSAARRDRRRSVLVHEGFGLVATAGRPLAAPTQLIEAPDITAVPTRQERVAMYLRFAALPGAVSYRAQLAADEAFYGVVADQIVSAPELKLAAPPDGDYWLRVRAIDAKGLEGVDAVKRIELRARPEPPFFSTPADGAKLRTDAPEFTWANVVGIDRYAIQIATDSAFERIVSESGDVGAAQFQPATRLPPGEYFWRVASVRADGYRGPFGDTQRLRLHALPAPPEPPAIQDGSIAFRWQSEPGQTFEFQMARDPEFADIVAARTLDEAEVKFELPAGGTYYMRVRAIDADGFVGPYTATQSFVVPARPWWLLLILVPLL